MARRSLPQSFGPVRLPTGPLDVDAARARLGGSAGAQPRMGECVRLIDGRGIEHRGVLLCLEDGKADVWIGGGRIIRASQHGLAEETHGDAALEDVAQRARRFAALELGGQLTWRGQDDTEHSGVLREKCRYGGLVETATGSVLAVSFTLLGGR